MVVESLAGYRVTRKLGEGSRAEVFLGHSDQAAESPVALKTYRPDASDVAAMTEIEALHRGAGPHVVRLIDVGPGAGGAPVLVLERLAGGSLDRLLRHRDRIEPGEAITILAPVAEAVARLHDVGVLHGGLGGDAVLFDASGAPVLIGFGRAALVAPGMSEAAREAEPGFAVDLNRFESLARSVLERVADPAAARLLDSPGTLVSFAAKLFDLAEPLPVRLASHESPASVPARVLRSELPVDGSPSVDTLPVAALALPEWVERMMPAALPGLVARLREAVSAVRRPVWIVAGAIAVTLVAALVLVPAGSAPDAAPAAPIASPTASTTPRAADGPVTGDDPVAAVRALLAARERCIRDLSVLCLDAVGQAGSSALAEDQALIRAMQSGDGEHGAPLPDPRAATLIERLGDSAIVSLAPDGQPASVLLMKGEAGWRIREYLSG